MRRSVAVTRRLRPVFVAAGSILVAVACGTGQTSTVPAAWHAVDPDPASDEGPVALVARDGGLVGVGGSRAWSTTDGTTWTSVVLPAAGEARAVDIAIRDGQLVAVGSAGSVASVWTSADGSTWSRVPPNAELTPMTSYGRTELQAVAAGPSGYVATGVEWGGSGQRAVAWWSSDGRDWRRAETEIGGSSGSDIVATDSGFVLTAADDARAGEFTRAMFWRSADGISWTEASGGASLRDAEANALVPHGNAIVAVGFQSMTDGGEFRLDPAAWTSTDGLSWEPAEKSAALGPWPLGGPTPPPGTNAIQGAVLTGVASLSDGLLAVGMQWSVEPGAATTGTHVLRFRSGIWRSADGRTWDVIPNELVDVKDESGQWRYGLTRVVPFRDGSLLLGQVPGAGAVVWVPDR